MTKLLVLSDDMRVSEAVNQLRGYEIVSQVPGTLSDPADMTVALLDAEYASFAGQFTQLEKISRVVVLVSDDKQRTLREYLHRNIADYMVKPVNVDLLQWRLDRVVGEQLLRIGSMYFRNEINHPLTPIQGWIEMVLQGYERNLPPDMLQMWLNNVKNNTARVEGVVRKHVDFVRLFTGQPEIVPLRLTETVRPIIDHARSVHSTITFLLTLPDDLPAVLSNDSFMRFVFDTLFTYLVPETRVDIAAAYDKPAGKVILSIRTDRLKGNAWREMLQYMVRKHRLMMSVEGRAIRLSFPVVSVK